MNSFIHVHRKREENLLAQPYYIQRLFTVTTHQLRAPISFILLFFPLSNIHVFPSYYYFSFCLTLSATWMWSCRRLIISRRIPRSTCSFFLHEENNNTNGICECDEVFYWKGVLLFFFSSLSSSLTIEAPYLSFKGLSVWPPVGRHFVAVVFLFYPNNNMKKTLVPSSLQRPPDHRRVISILLTCSGRRDTTKKLPPVFFFYLFFLQNIF